MLQIQKQLNKIKQENRLGIMTHIVVGCPSLEENKKIIQLMADIGVDFIELQIPFSDPMADGPTIMKANKQALDNKTRVIDAFNLMKEMSSQVNIPLLFMGYFNTVLNYGTKRFCQEAARLGCSGLIFPDIPLEEESEEHFLEYTKKYNLSNIRVLSPASTIDRIKKNAKVANGFLYFVGRKGTTGAKTRLDKTLNINLRKIKKHIKIPIAVGFGISEVAHIKALVGKAEIAVIGSAVIDRYKKAKIGEELKEIKKFMKPLVDSARS
ncbi:tryptophan synthase subunit alpha [Candidatus Falkowbacteria bacterium CG11_big_fil_rev_8_21_14_0_20_39_10]|uniref:Tryptophan synthase alpha chain n=1 Tax=Candidatus Falkowbacteria bacterium CG11_big_fil_rev_8_21_14_0_20_39_10 TaxID=1974570 RepID=A0A2M6K8Y4_9BACT|nr:MAG: tryptophan synthase subunit alpha [Candidatus Falkowbacteria bacterium CG11_big_fil_rev_8_21_14_0_20_39_10]